ncbi:MAG: methyltransferase domain-containing protein [Terriglobia bacterium]
MSLQRLKQEWEDLAQMDPFWAILTFPDRKFGRWKVDEFFHTGWLEINQVMNWTRPLGRPSKKDMVLDFGCGVGRLTRALAGHFEQAYGLDISENMLAKARELNQPYPNCRFILNTENHLGIFPDNSFDMVYTNKVLQHIASRRVIRDYLGEFLRVLKRGGLLVFQLLSYIPVRNRFQPRRRLYSLLRAIGISEHILYEKIGLHPLCANYISQDEVIYFLRALGGRVLLIQPDPNLTPTIQSRHYYVTK